MMDMNLLKKTLAAHKVYDAWQYVESLRETTGYMKASYEMLVKVYNHRIDTLAEVERSILSEAHKTGKASCKTSDLNRTNLVIGGYEIDDSFFLRKTSIEFFHYARISMDVLFQIVNAALLGDDAIPVEDKGLLRKLLAKLAAKPEFGTLLQLIDNNKNDARFQYLMAFDNYMKHIKTILVTVKNSIFIGKEKMFKINAFTYGGVEYAEEDVLTKTHEIHDYVVQTLDDILKEIVSQIPNCISNSQRIQEIHYKFGFTEKGGKTYTDYLSFFIDVANDISDLPAEIKVYPLLIKPNDEIYSFDFRFNKIFIRKAGSEEDKIVGVATLKNGIATNEVYRVFEVKACTQQDYGLYVATFKSAYPAMRLNLNLAAMDGVMLFIKDDVENANMENPRNDEGVEDKAE